MNLPQLNEQIQRIVGAEQDGIWGIESAQKTLARLTGFAVGEHGAVPVVQPLPMDADLVDSRSEKVFASLQKEVVPYMRALVHTAAKHGIRIVATSGLRTYDEQDELYKQGRSKPGKIVTNARGGYSSHNFGTAVDFTIFDGEKPIWESPKYAVVGGLGKSIGLSWGGDWDNADEPHFYLKPNWAKDMNESNMMAGLRERHNENRPIFA